MPLHLLGKKSWNVYSKDNIERVRRDEAAAAAREEEHERRMEEYDANRRIAVLRGQKPPSPPPELEEEHQQKHRREEHHGHDRQDRRKRRRLAGEDDTDRDIRLAKEDADAVAAVSSQALAKQRSESSAKSKNAPLYDHEGHINLFPQDVRASRDVEKNDEAEAEKRRKEREYEDQYTMRFSNAAGRDGLERPWYAGPDGPQRPAADGAAEDEAIVEHKNVWGRPDPRRKEREQMRTSTNDPLAMMKSAQSRLKRSEADKQRWKEQRERETRDSRRRDELDRVRKRGAGDEENDDLEGFSLDAPRSKVEERSSGRHRSHRQRSRDRRRSRSRDRAHTHAGKSRGSDRDLER